MPVQHTRAMNLPPDPDGQNDDRGEWAEMAIKAFRDQTGCDLEDAISDLLADIGHWCDRNGMNFQDELSRASMHYGAETGDKGTQL